MTATLHSRPVAAACNVPSKAKKPIGQSFGVTSHSSNQDVDLATRNANIRGVEKMPTIATLFALAQNNRLDVFQIVVEGGAEGVPAGEIRHRLGLRKSLISFHLKQLRMAGLVTLRREGRIFIYTAQNYTVNRLMAYLTDNCSPDGPLAAG